jgi:hypothetical protein
LANFLFISQQEVSADIIQNLAVGSFSPKTEGTKTKAARCLFFLMPFPFLHILNFLQSSLIVNLMKVCLLVKETAGMAEKSSWDQANIWQKLGLVWRKRKKLSKTIFTYCSSS